MEKPRLKSGVYKLADWLVASKLLYGALILFFAAYLMTKSATFALLVALSIAGEFIAETLSGVGKHGWFNELKEIGVAILIALLFWFGGGMLLHTSAPLDAVVSCSMLPSLERGDMMVLQGALPNAPEVSVAASGWDPQGQAAENSWCGLCRKAGNDYYELCAGTPIHMVEERSAAGRLQSYGVVVNETNPSGPVQVGCGWCDVKLDSGETAKTPCAKNLTIGSTTLTENLSNDIIVYTAAPTDAMRGDIIHRTYARVNVEGKYYFITKGDNNPQFDFQYGNAPVPQERFVGKTVLRIPYLGYVKLFLFGYLENPQGCDARMLH